MSPGAARPEALDPGAKSAPLDPTRLREGYRAFLGEGGRILLTGHSHQAWPDVAREGLLRAFEDAAELVDHKWGRAMAAADELRAAICRRDGGAPDRVALGQSTHELLLRFLSALDLRARPHVVTTDGEFHSLRRQLRRLEEEGLEVSWVPAAPLSTLAERLGAAVREDTAALMASTVLFQTAAVVPHLEAAVEAAHRVGAEVLLDAYHAFNVVPYRLQSHGRVFLVAGGYKYAQWGEGCCFMHIPEGFEGRPALTGWFADFGGLDKTQDKAREEGLVGYGGRLADRFAGSTYDPSSHYRACAVDRFFLEQGMSVEALRELSLRQTDRLIAGLFGGAGGAGFLPEEALLTPREQALRGGFVALRAEDARAKVEKLHTRGVYSDARGEILRLGPAPYTTFEEIDRAVELAREVWARP